MNTLYISLILLAITTKTVYSIRTKDKMYEDIPGNAVCFRRMNGTHQTGCSSEKEGSTGVIHFVETKEDLDFILSKGEAGPYMPVIPTALFDLESVDSILKSHKVSGLVVYKESRQLEHFSHEYQCPNRLSGLESTCSKNWNPFGTGLLYRDFPFPIFYIDNQTDVVKIKDCFEKFNNFSYEFQHDRPLCSLEIKSFMFATTDTPTCLRRSNAKLSLNPVRFCDPVGGESVWSSLYPVADNSSDTPKETKYIAIAARIDSTSMFNGVVPGAANPVTGFVTLLTVAQLLRKLFPDMNNKYGKNVLFFLLNGETYDYIGSQRLLYDMENEEFPFKLNKNTKWIQNIKPENISLFIELSQLGHKDAVHAHILEKRSEIIQFLDKLTENKPTALTLTKDVGALPPASLQTFLKSHPETNGVVVTDHGDTYSNAFYNSIYDNSTNIGFIYYENITDDSDAALIPSGSIQRHLADVADMVAKSVFEEVTGEGYSGKETASVALVNELLHCYLEDVNCKVHQVVQHKKLSENLYNFYVGVTVGPTILTSLIGLTLAWVTGEVTENPCVNDPKNQIIRYFNMSKSLDDLNTTVCYKTTLNFMEAKSPAFLIDNYDWSSGRYSSWTESTWQDIKVRLFLKPSRGHEIFTITLGTSVLLLSMVFVYFFKTHSDALFASSETSTPTRC